MTSPLSVPRTIPEASFSPYASSHTSPYNRSPSQHPNGPPISPPKTRSASADDNSAALVEDWRQYTQKLRSQSEGERAHMMADRARVEEVMAEERALWDRERDILKARIAELEGQLEQRGGSGTFAPVLHHKHSTTNMRGQQAMGFTSPPSNAGSVAGSIDRTVPQESGRNADGTPFYAPAPRNPTRTFEASETSDLRVDSITAPRESAIRVTSKELTSSDFGVQSPPNGGSTHDLETIPETPTETIDISHIQPELEGVAIKASAVSPTFAAKVLSPAYSPPKLSPNTKPPPRDATSLSPLNTTNNLAPRQTLEIANEPENRRLTMHAGHTPNHSISKFEFLGGSGGDETPTQEHHEETTHRPEHVHRPSMASAFDGPSDPDPELSGPLGLTNDKAVDDPFLAELVEKLKEAKKSEGTSPSSESEISLKSDEVKEEGEKDDGPPLRLKPSFNFGRPLGSM